MSRIIFLSTLSAGPRGPLATALVLTAFHPSMLAAQTTSPTATAQTVAPDNRQVGEIVVTAQKRVESLEKVPISAQVVTGQALQAKNYVSLQDIGQIVPGLHIVDTGSFSNSLNIRGIGSGAQNPAFDQSVSTFVDDIYYGRSRMVQSTFLDMERIEVLKGPQSTFFGNNAIAGALNEITKKPDDHFDGYARALYGSYNTYAVEAASSVPLSDKFALRIAGTADGTSGWIHSVNTGTTAPRDRNYQGRVTGRWTPSADFDATLKLEGGSSRIDGATSNIPGQLVNCPPPSPLKAGAADNFCPYALAYGAPIGLNTNNNATLPGQFAHLVSEDAVLTLNYRHDGLTFTSVTGGYGYQFTAQDDNASVGDHVESTVTTQPEKYRQFSQELRITSPSDNRISFLAGAYFQADKLSENVYGNAAFIDSSLPVYAKYGYLPAADLPLVTLPLGYATPYAQTEQVGSIFGAVTWNATSKLKFNLGLRGTTDHKHFDGAIEYGQAPTFGAITPYPLAVQQGLSFLLGAPNSYIYSRTDKAILGTAGLQYQATTDTMAYFTYSRGFKAGGFNALSPSLIGGLLQPTFGPEHVNSYEAGLKNRLFQNRLVFNLALFREDYAALQLSSLIPLPTGTAQSGVANAGKARSQGVEGEIQTVPFPNFRFFADVTYLDAKYLSYPGASPTFLEKQNKVTSQNLSGRPLDFAPRWSASATAEYTVPFRSGYKLMVDLSPIVQTSYFNSAGTDDPLLHISGNLRLDGKITLESADARWDLDLIGKNLTNAVIPLTFGTNDTPGGKQEPINLAVQLRYKW